ncbi:Hypothetical protein LUCI_3784 [Lucifera butyrica]|uniref:DUF456 domain-containing protein n=1 Tax=Lucifera butyrica TaxID=1351585 RepID=A0A498RAQ6_9FIRM|nr:DUF456 domain-containing protein [Lucifera butyrica]VBB08511.1 Hypothetical protein LUCI_3784 [Lucifera butyrica]
MHLFINLGIIALLILATGMTLFSLPGNAVLFLTALGYGFYDHFTHMSYLILFFLLAALIAGEWLEFTAASRANRRQTAWKTTLATFLGASAGGLFGTDLLPVVGSLLGALAGSLITNYAVEYLRTSSVRQARTAAVRAITGQIWGYAIKLAIALGMSITILYTLVW